MSRTGDWIATFSGVRWFVTDPDPADVRVEDIAHALSMICRYGGHCTSFYSVAEHCVRMAEIADLEHGPDAGIWALLHDAPESYLGDIVRPLKHGMAMDGYRAAEGRTEEVIIAGLGFKPPSDQCREYVKYLDDVLLMTERRDLVNHCGYEWQPKAEPLLTKIVPMTQPAAKAMFRTLFKKLLDEGGLQ